LILLLPNSLRQNNRKRQEWHIMIQILAAVSAPIIGTGKAAKFAIHAHRGPGANVASGTSRQETRRMIPKWIWKLMAWSRCQTYGLPKYPKRKRPTKKNAGNRLSMTELEQAIRDRDEASRKLAETRRKYVEAERKWDAADHRVRRLQAEATGEAKNVNG
jgi:hypothetical protein